MNFVREWIIKALTEVTYEHQGKARRLEKVELPPSERLVYGIQFCFVALGLLTALEIVYILRMGTFNSGIFSAITGIIGTVTGVIFSRK